MSKLLQFDVDSEVFELTVAMLKQKAENKYQKLIELMIEKSKEEFSNNKSNYTVFNILILSMQVVDDILYRKEFLGLLLKNKDKIIKNLKRIHNTHMIVDMFAQDIESNKKICEIYYDEAMISVVSKTLLLFEIEENIVEKEKMFEADYDSRYKYSNMVRQRILLNNPTYSNDFYVSIFMKTENILEILYNLEINHIHEIYVKRFGYKVAKKRLKRLKEFLSYFVNLSSEEKETFYNILITDI